MTLQQMFSSKLELGLTCEDIAEGSGVPISTVRKVFSQQTKAPRRQTLEALSNYFESKYHPAQVRYFHEEASRIERKYQPGSGTLTVSEPLSSAERDDQGFKINSIYTIDEFDEMPMYPRTEVIDGEIITMEAPLFVHQDAVAEFLIQTKSFIQENKGMCKAMISPLAVQPIKEDKKNVVQPDFLVVCDSEKLEDGRHVIGAPDWIVEVLSPSTRKTDMVKKRDLYKAAGVREYWMVDLEGECVILYEFEKTDNPSIRQMDKPIPVGIYDGELEIDLSGLI